MTEPIQKADLRGKIRTVLKQIPPAVRSAESIDLCNRMEPQLHSAHTILFFAPLPDELDIWPLIEKFLTEGKICALPGFDETSQTYSARRIENIERDVVSGKFGVREPAPGCAEVALEKFDLILVPGMAFDLHGNRLGRGLGFYDRLLQKISGVKCGVCHDFQLQAHIPTEPHDAKVTFVFTPSRCVRRKS